MVDFLNSPRAVMGKSSELKAVKGVKFTRKDCPPCDTVAHSVGKNFRRPLLQFPCFTCGPMRFNYFQKPCSQSEDSGGSAHGSGLPRPVLTFLPAIVSGDRITSEQPEPSKIMYAEVKMDLFLSIAQNALGRMRKHYSFSHLQSGLMGYRSEVIKQILYELNPLVHSQCKHFRSTRATFEKAEIGKNSSLRSSSLYMFLYINILIYKYLYI